MLKNRGVKVMVIVLVSAVFIFSGCTSDDSEGEYNQAENGYAAEYEAEPTPPAYVGVPSPVPPAGNVAGNDGDSEDNIVLSETVQTAYNSVSALMRQLSAAGAVVAVVDAQEGFTWIQGFGYADTEQGRIVDENTVFMLGSVSKSITAMAVMQLVEAGIIDLDEPIVTYLPEFYSSPTVFAGEGDYRNITARMLLSHSSGISPDFLGTGVMTTQEQETAFMNNLLENLAAHPMLFAEGSGFSYANNNFNLLGLLVARMSGYTDIFDGFVNHTRQNIFEPLGMSRSAFALNDSHLPYLAMPYTNAETRADKIFYNGIATGGLYSTAHDMARFMHAVLHGGEYGGNRIISESTLAQMFEKHRLETESEMDFMPVNALLLRPGLGFLHTTDMDGFGYWGHSGGLPHYISNMIFCFENGIGVFVAVNSTSGGAVPISMASVILRAAITEKTGTFELPVPDPNVTPIERSAEELEAYTGLFVFTGAPELSRIFVRNGVLHLFDPFSGHTVPLQPLSDGSFVFTPSGARFWFVELGGTLVIFQGELATIFAAVRHDEESLRAAESFAQWVGAYYPLLEENHVSIFTRVLLGIDDDGFAYDITDTLMGTSVFFPVVHMAENNYGGMVFGTDGTDTWFDFLGQRFIRQ